MTLASELSLCNSFLFSNVLRAPTYLRLGHGVFQDLELGYVPVVVRCGRDEGTQVQRKAHSLCMHWGMFQGKGRMWNMLKSTTPLVKDWSKVSAKREIAIKAVTA